MSFKNYRTIRISVAKVRISEGLKEKVKEQVRENNEYSSQKEFVSSAIRRLLEQEQETVSKEEIIQQIKKDIEKGELEIG